MPAVCPAPQFTVTTRGWGVTVTVVLALAVFPTESVTVSLIGKTPFTEHKTEIVLVVEDPLQLPGRVQANV